MEWEREVLEQRYAKVKAERDALYSNLQSAVYEVQQKAGFKNMLLNKKTNLLKKKLDTNAVMLGEAIAAGATSAGGAGEVHRVETAEAAATLAETLVNRGDAVFVKASRGVGLEVVSNRLRGRWETTA